MRYGDEEGIFWVDQPAVRRNELGDRPLPPLPETDWNLPEGLDAYPSLEGRGAIAIDVETYDPDLKSKGPGVRRNGRLVGVAVGTEDGWRQYYPFGHETGPNLVREHVLEWLSRELCRPVPKIGANLLYDLDFLEAAGVKVAGPFYDVQVAEPLLDENRLTYSLESLARDYLGEGKFEEPMARWLRNAFTTEQNIKSNLWRAPATVVGPYAESDVDLPLRIFAIQRQRLVESKLWDLFELESALIPMLLAMRQRGVRVDLERAGKLEQDMTTRQGEVVAEIKRVTGVGVDIWAAASIAKMFDAAGVTYPRTEKTDAPSFRRTWLEACPAPEARLLVEARRLDKFRSTFLRGAILEGQIGGRIHCQFHQLRGDGYGTVSGRFSSSGPNLQNQPIRDPHFGKIIRSLFVPEDGERWWKFDWSQIEFRLAVHYAARLGLAGIDKVIEQYNDPSTDYHAVVAQLTGLPRSTAKSVNFGFVYGMGVETLCYQLGVTRDVGNEILAQYHQRVPFVRPLYKAASDKVIRYGNIRTIGGRLRRFKTFSFDIDYENGKTLYEEEDVLLEKYKTVDGILRARWKRVNNHKALNALLQGSAADIMKTGMLQIWRSGVCDVLGAPHLTVHDELDGSVPQGKEGQEALAEIKNIMETCVKIAVPMLADGGLGMNWGTLE